MDKFLERHYKKIIVAVMAFFTIVSVLNAKNDSATFDEVAHIPAGYSYLTQHEIRLNPEHPPLLKDLAGFPLLFLHLKFDTSLPFWTGDLPGLWDDGQWAAGRHLLYEAGNNPDMIIFLARLPIVIISIIFGLFLFKWGREMAGLKAGLFIYLLYSFDPNILGHNHYVTTDLGIAAFLAFSFYYFLKFIKYPTWKNTIIGGIFLGLANVTKFSAVTAYPIFGLILISYPFLKKISHDEGENKNLSLRFKTFFQYLGKGIVAFAVATLLIWVVYKFNTYNMPQEVIAKQIEFSFPQSDPNIKSIYSNKALTLLNSNFLTRPLTDYVLGVFMVFKRVSGGNGAYFLGQVSSHAFVAYFPVVFLIKETIPFLFLIAFALIYTMVEFFAKFRQNISFKQRMSNFWRIEVVEYAAFGFIVLYAYLSITGNLNIGFRHLFPILPFAYLLVTKKVFDFINNSHAVTQKTLHWISLILIAWIIIIPIINYPGYVSYFNETIGGSKNGYKYVTDSNTDWGQDLKRLKVFLDNNPKIAKIHVDYFGGGNPQYYLGDKYLPWSDSIRPIEKGWYAISTNYSQGSIYDTTRSDDETYRWLKNYQPVAMIGNSILIYYVSTPPVQ